MCNYNNLSCAILYHFSPVILFSVILSLLGANSRTFPCMSMTTIEPQLASCGLASAELTGCLYEKKSSFRNSTHSTVWTRQLLSVKDKQTDREWRQRGRERGEKNVGDMEICKGARAKYKPVKNAVFCFSMRCSDDTYEIGMS